MSITETAKQLANVGTDSESSPASPEDWAEVAKGLRSKALIEAHYEMTHGLVTAKTGSEGYQNACENYEKANRFADATAKLLEISAHADIIAELGPVEAFFMLRKQKRLLKKSQKQEGGTNV